MMGCMLDVFLSKILASRAMSNRFVKDHFPPEILLYNIY